MDKLFEGISKVRFTDREEVDQMISAEQERVDLQIKVDVNEGNKKGNVELWMKEIEEVMIKTLRTKTKESNMDYQKTPMEQWVSKWPGQIVLAVDQINWTSGVEAAFEQKDL
jgi:dynein heavy chain, axonemal